MLFVIHCLDKTTVEAAAARQANYPAHRAFLNETDQYDIQIVTSGPLVSDDGKAPIGSFFIIEAASRAKAEAFNHADPFYKAGIWGTVNVTAFDKKTRVGTSNIDSA